MARRSKRNRTNVAKTFPKNPKALFNRSLARFLGRNDTLVSTPKKKAKWKTNYSVGPDEVIDDNTSRRSRSERAAKMLDRKKRDILASRTTTFHTPLRGVTKSGGVQQAQSPVQDSQRKMRDCVQRPDPNRGRSQFKKAEKKFVKWC